MFCKKCGTQLTDGVSFCKNCGAPVVKPQPAPQPQPTPQPQPRPVQQAPVQPTPAPAPQPRPVQQAPVQPQMAPQQPQKKGGAGKIIAIILVILALAGAIFGGVYYVTHKDDTDKKGKHEKEEEIDPADIGGGSTTLMIYIVGSNLESGDIYSAGGAASRDIDEMLDAKIPDGCNVVLECGGAKQWENKEIPDGEVTIFSIQNGKLKQEKSLGKTTMTKKGDLTDFINYSKENFPAEHYSLILWDHGGGIPVGFGMDELGDPYDLMNVYEIDAELDAADVDFDAVIFDACNMCTLEMGMALKDHASFMVGAESYVNNAGIYYSNWLELLDGDTQSYCEKIVQDYMDDIGKDDLVGSMSVIRLDKIEDVYDAYVTYIGDVSSDVQNGDFASYVKGRGNCGSFEGDSVDLIALATAYDTENASTLINSAVNAVTYTESDFSYGHGIMVYSPYEDYDQYTEGREAFLELEYDDSVTNFYDGLISVELAYMGDSAITAYGGDWYTDDFTSGVTVGSGGSSYDLPVIETSNYYAVELDDEDWDVVDHVALTICVESDGEYLMLGQDYTYEIDDDGMLALVDPEAWTFVNGNIAPYYCVDYYSNPDTGEWSQLGYIPVTINGEGALLYIYYDEDHPEGTIQGYTTYDYDTDTEGSYLYDLYDDDEIDLVFSVFSTDGDDYYMSMDEPFLYSDMELTYSAIDLNDYTTIGYYTVYDVYGNEYETDAVYLGSADAV